MKINNFDDLQRSTQTSLQLEIDALQHLAQNIDYQILNQILNLILNCQGRVIFCGLGKSGHIAKKIAATWASTGTPSFFVHAAEALHGDLGMFTPADVVIMVSNSGESDELLRLVPFVQQRHIPLIAWVGNLASTLARHADLALYVGSPHELLTPNELGIVPLASCLTTLAMGDLLTVLLVQHKSFNINDFRLFHPGGNIGQKLLSAASERMKTEQLPIANPQTPMREVLVAMTQGSFGIVVICAPNQKPLAVITDGDIRRALQRSADADFFALKAADIATTQPKTLPHTATLWEAEQLMNQHKITCLPITNADGQFCGLLSKHQL